MQQVFCTLSYGVFSIPDFFDEFYKFIGHFQIEQTIKQSYDRVFDIWFFTYKVILKEGESRQVEIVCKRTDDNKLEFEINKI